MFLLVSDDAEMQCDVVRNIIGRNCIVVFLYCVHVHCRNRSAEFRALYLANLRFMSTSLYGIRSVSVRKQSMLDHFVLFKIMCPTPHLYPWQSQKRNLMTKHAVGKLSDISIPATIVIKHIPNVAEIL